MVVTDRVYSMVSGQRQPIFYKTSPGQKIRRKKPGGVGHSPSSMTDLVTIADPADSDRAPKIGPIPSAMGHENEPGR